MLDSGQSCFIFFTIILVSIVIFSAFPTAYAAEVEVRNAPGSSVPGCEDTNECFLPGVVNIAIGDTVTWVNDDTAAHTSTSGTPGSPDGNWDSSLVMVGISFSHTFDESGDYPYHCMVHPWMTGMIIVKGTSTPTPTPSPTPTIPYGTDITIPMGTSVPGCEDSNSCYTPYRFTAKVGDTVNWFNADWAAHTVTSGIPSNGPNGVFDSSMILSGQTFSHKFTRSGTYDYFSMMHPWQTGKIIIIGSSTPPPTPTPSPTPYPRDNTPPKILKPSDVIVDADDPKGTIVTYDVLVIDDTDRIVRPFCSPSSGSFFSVGDSTVTCSATDYSGNRASKVSFMITVIPPGVAIPNWVKNVAAFWCDDKIDDAAFIDGIQYLIDNNIILVSGGTSGYGISQGIPSWVKNNACWWSDGLISDLDFASGIEYLISQGIIRV